MSGCVRVTHLHTVTCRDAVVVSRGAGAPAGSALRSLAACRDVRIRSSAYTNTHMPCCTVRTPRCRRYNLLSSSHRVNTCHANSGILGRVHSQETGLQSDTHSYSQGNPRTILVQDALVQKTGIGQQAQTGWLNSGQVHSGAPLLL